MAAIFSETNWPPGKGICHISCDI